jgi:hypothetical protein
MVVRIQVTSFRFCASRDTRSEGCQDSFDQAEATLIYTIEGHPEYDANKQPGIPREPVTALKRDGWDELHKPRMGFKRAAEFEKLTLAVPVDCRCACGDKVQVKHLKWEVNYDRSSTGGPTMTLTDTSTNQKITPKQRTTPTATPGENNVSAMWPVDVDCPCPDSKPCFFAFCIEYTYRSVSEPD